MTGPVPPAAPRTDPVARLRREVWHATNAGEHALAARLQHQLDTLSSPPQPETTAAAPPRRETTSRTRVRNPRVPRQ
ncbi:3-oxoacyl-ACP reductase-like protein [Kitasatospora sp. MAA4]|nr:3-oxoacyl-ACP reductase-like protein [Kitasatospora sp. MAA4]